jgi:hypothetical protein
MDLYYRSAGIHENRAKRSTALVNIMSQKSYSWRWPPAFLQPIWTRTTGRLVLMKTEVLHCTCSRVAPHGQLWSSQKLPCQKRGREGGKGFVMLGTTHAAGPICTNRQLPYLNLLTSPACLSMFMISQIMRLHGNVILLHHLRVKVGNLPFLKYEESAAYQ